MSFVEEKDFRLNVVQHLNALLDVRGGLFMMQLEMGQDDPDLMLIRESVRVLKRVHEIWVQDVVLRVENKRGKLGDDSVHLSEDMERVIEWLKKVTCRLRPLNLEIESLQHSQAFLKQYVNHPQSAVDVLSGNDKAFLYLCLSIGDGIDEEE
ncbi:MAG: hypothetical protein ACOY3I_06130 [Verrucomicrobiota bacterium]